LISDPERENRVRARAYRLWEEEGRPHGRDVEFWERARELEAMEESAGSGQVPVAPPRPDEAEIEENLGEFPGPMTDQGDREQTPAPVRRAPRGTGRRKRGKSP
jgi:hypothetical protein